MGFIVMILLVVGIFLILFKVKSEGKFDNLEFKKVMGILFLLIIGYVGYVVFGDIFGVSGIDVFFF